MRQLATNTSVCVVQFRLGSDRICPSVAVQTFAEDRDEEPTIRWRLVMPFLLLFDGRMGRWGGLAKSGPTVGVLVVPQFMWPPASLQSPSLPGIQSSPVPGGLLASTHLSLHLRLPHIHLPSCTFTCRAPLHSTLPLIPCTDLLCATPPGGLKSHPQLFHPFLFLSGAAQVHTAGGRFRKKEWWRWFLMLWHLCLPPDTRRTRHPSGTNPSGRIQGWGPEVALSLVIFFFSSSSLVFDTSTSTSVMCNKNMLLSHITQTSPWRVHDFPCLFIILSLKTTQKQFKHVPTITISTHMNVQLANSTHPVLNYQTTESGNTPAKENYEHFSELGLHPGS